EALALEREAYEIERKYRPEDDPENGGNLASIGNLLLKMKKWTEAESTLREALAFREKHLPPDDWHVANTRSMLGEALGEQRKDAEAEPLLVGGAKALAGNAKAPEDTRAESRARVARFYRA